MEKYGLKVIYYVFRITGKQEEEIDFAVIEREFSCKQLKQKTKGKTKEVFLLSEKPIESFVKQNH